METTTAFPRQERVPKADRRQRPPACPICGGELMRLDGFCRCPQCRYTFCDSCEGALEEMRS